MKLSSKFFCIAYIVVLLSTGAGGMFIIRNINETLWNTQMERVHTAVKYAADSFLAFADVSYEEITGHQKQNILRQIQDSLDSVVTEIEVYTERTVSDEYTTLENNDGVSRFEKRDDLLLMETVCRLNTGADTYFLAVRADLTETQQQCMRLWGSYGVVVFAISASSGLLLFMLARKITRPLHQLTRAADEIAIGNYGKKVDVHSADREIINLSESFNCMSSAVEQKIKEIKEESQKRDMFVANFTHELKTPMTAIMGYAQMLNAYELDETETKEASTAIYNEAKRLEKLSLQLLELYVFQNEKPEIGAVDLSLVGMQLETTLKHVSEKYGVLFEVAFGNETVSANVPLLLSLLYNLADNAFKASLPHSTVRIYSKASADTVSLFVEDSGRGIAKENIKFLTEPFYREDASRSRKLGGAGLGLSLCKEIALLHGTSLCFESEKGKGTTVSFTLQKGGETNA